MAGADEIVRHVRSSEEPSYVLRVSGLVPPPRLVAPDALEWHAVVRTPTLCVRVALETTHDITTLGATLYRGGVRWQPLV